MALSVWTSSIPSLHSLISFIHPSLDFLVVWFVSLYSQLALLVAVTGIGGNFSGTGAEGGSQSPGAAPDPTPGGPHADKGPSEEEAQLGRKTERER